MKTTNRRLIIGMSIILAIACIIFIGKIYAQDEEKVDVIGELLEEMMEEIRGLRAENRMLRFEKSLLEADNQALLKENEELKANNITLQTEEEWLEFSATAYCLTGVTWSGLEVSEKLIAVDPKVIPIGSVVEIEGIGRVIAADTGGLIKKQKIDIYIPDYDDCIQWGVRPVKLKIIHEGDNTRITPEEYRVLIEKFF